MPVKKSVFPEFIICLEDGKKLKMLKRHLKTSYNMSPDEYRTKWRLPRDYPMVAPAMPRTGSTLAKKIGLGRKPAEAPAEVVQHPARARRQGLSGAFQARSTHQKTPFGEPIGANWQLPQLEV